MLSKNPRPAGARGYYSRTSVLRGSATYSAAGAGTVARVQAMAARMADGPRNGRTVSRPAGGATLTVHVLAGVGPESGESATFSRILRGIHERAKLEISERPGLERLRIAVHRLPPGGFHPGGAVLPVFRRVRAGDRHGALLVHRFRETAEECVLRRIAAVSVLASHEGTGIDVIETDDTAISSMVGCLHAAGHTRIGFLARDETVADACAERRFLGFVQGLTGCGLTLNRDWVLGIRGDSPLLNPEQAAEAAVRASRRSAVTAWVCADDPQAYRLMRSLQAGGMRVPQDCSVTGFGGIEPPAGLPRATSLRVPHEHVGATALTRVINRILYPSSPQRRIVIEPQVVPGESIAAPCRR
jgi:LacI family transcriptional regulator